MEHEEHNAQKERYEELKAQSKRLKKRILIIMGCVIGAVILLFALLKLLDWINERNVGVPEGTYTFYSPYEGDIMEYQDYLELNRMVDYCEDSLGYGLKQSITDENHDEFDANVLFLYDYLQTIIHGDAVTYNTYFNDTYFKDNEPKSSFYQQMIYNAVIYYESTEKQENGETLAVYRLEYMIHRNDGTFRRDVDSDASRPQYITLRVGADGTVKIERIITVYTKK